MGERPSLAFGRGGLASAKRTRVGEGSVAQKEDFPHRQACRCAPRPATSPASGGRFASPSNAHNSRRKSPPYQGLAPVEPPSPHHPRQPCHPVAREGSGPGETWRMFGGNADRDLAVWRFVTLFLRQAHAPTPTRCDAPDPGLSPRVRNRRQGLITSLMQPSAFSWKVLYASGPSSSPIL
jgi:hypothetical protein